MPVTVHGTRLTAAARRRLARASLLYLADPRPLTFAFELRPGGEFEVWIYRFGEVVKRGVFYYER